MPTLQKLRKVRPDLVEFDSKEKLHLSFDTVSNQWRDPLEQPRTFCGRKVAWFLSKRPGWDGDEVATISDAPYARPRPVCRGCLDMWARAHPGRLPGQ